VDGLNSTCLFIFLCPVALLIGVAAFFPLSAGASRMLGKKRETLGRGIGVVLALFVAVVVFYLMFGPSTPGFYQPWWRPNSNDIYGVWVPDSFTLTVMEENGYPVATPSLELHDDGTAIITDLPDTIFHGRQRVLHSGKGTWFIERYGQGTWVVEIVLNSLTPSYVPITIRDDHKLCPGESVPCGGLAIIFEINNSRPPYILVSDFVGGDLDPNLGFFRQGDNHDQ
jgi:hypothetical protein